MTDRNQQRREERSQRKAKGLCTLCGKQALKGYVRCKNCIEGKRAKCQLLAKENLCINCKSQTHDGQKRCPTCILYFKERRAKFKEHGECLRCGKQRTKDSSTCQECYLKITSKTHLGTAKHWRVIEGIFKDQNGECPYTGKNLTLGVNTELDHIVPRSSGGSNEKENLQWVWSPVNKMKWTFSESEFMEVVHLIHKHLKL